MKRFTSRRNLTRRFSGRGVSVVGTAMLVGGLLLPITPAMADRADVTIEVGSVPMSLAINPTGTYAYVTNAKSGTISLINLATNSEEGAWPIGVTPFGLAINPAGTFFYFTDIRLRDDPGNMVHRIKIDKNNVRSISVEANIEVGLHPIYVAIDPAGRFAYVVNLDSDTVSKINIATNAVDATIAVGDGPVAVAIDGAGTFAYVVNLDSDTVSKINIATNAVDATIEVGRNPENIAINSAGTFAYVTRLGVNGAFGTVARINLTTYALDATIVVGVNPYSIVINPAGSFAYVANYKSDTVSKISLETNTVVETIKVGNGPISIAINPAGTFAYVLNNGSGTVTRIKLTSNVSVATSTSIITTSKSASAKTLAGYLKLAVPNGATISINVAPSSSKYCKVSGSTLRGIKTGPCTVTVSVKPKSGKAVSKTMTFTVSK